MPSPWPRRSGDLVLRDATPVDVDQLLTFRNDPAVNRWMMRTSVEPEEFRRGWAAVPDSETDHSCVAERDGTVVAMGFLELVDHGLHEETPRGGEALIGYIVDPRHAGQGVATDLTRGLLAVAFDTLGLRRVKAYCNRDNPASSRVMEKAGMRREEHGVEDSWHAEHGWVDGYGYAILAQEWRGEVRGLREIRDASAAVPPRRALPEAVPWESGARHTARLSLGDASPDDVDQMLRYRNRPDVGRLMLRTQVEPRAFRRAWLEPGENDRSFVARLGDRVVGTCSIAVRDGSGQPGGPVQGCEAELGYVLDPAFHGQGYGREIAAAGLDRCFRELGVRRVTAGLYADNVASARLLSGLGMRLEQYGVRDSWHPDHGWVDGAAYGLLAREWRA